MKRQIRRGVFETNSSSVHSLTICSQEEYDAWVKGEMILDTHSDKFINASEAENDAWRYQSYSNYQSRCNDLETFTEKHTTKSGDKIVAFGYSGYDG